MLGIDRVKKAGDLKRFPALGQLLQRRWSLKSAIGSSPLRAQSRRLDRISAEATLDRPQGEARQHHQAGQSLLAMAAGYRRYGRHSICATTRHQAAVARTFNGALARKGGGGCARQQDRTDGLGHHGSQREIQEPTLLLAA